MANPVYSYGSFSFNDNISYFVMDKPYDSTPFIQTLFKVARLEGQKKTGESINERTIQVKIKVIGTSRVALEQNLEAMYQAFALRQQNLVLYATDQRYFVADCVNVSAPLTGGTPISTVATATFTCQQPFAFAPTASSFNTGNVTLSSAGSGSWTFPVQTFAGGGSIFSRPQITLVNQNPDCNNTLTTGITVGNNYTSLTVSALSAAVVIGDTFILTNGVRTQSVVAAAPALAGTTSLTVASFNANFSYPGSGATTVNLNNTWTNLVVAQQTDNQTMTISTGLPVIMNDRIDIYCDPNMAINGYTVQYNQSGTPLAFMGVFPVLEPTSTSWLITITAASPPVVSVVWAWTSRWLA